MRVLPISRIPISPNIQLDTASQCIIKGKEEIQLTRKEFKILKFLALNAGSIVSRAQLLEHVWDMNANPFSNTIETHILNLRKKIGSRPPKDIIRTISGRGYRVDLKRQD